MIPFSAMSSGLCKYGEGPGFPQKLMPHAQVATTMDVYGNALMESKREANRGVVGLLLRLFRELAVITAIEKVQSVGSEALNRAMENTWVHAVVAAVLK